MPTVDPNKSIGVGNRDSRGYLVKDERMNGSRVERRILERPAGGMPFSSQTKINAYNFPFTFNPGAGCFFKCAYCYLRQPFFQRHVQAGHGREMNYTPNLAAAAEIFLKAREGLPQYMKRVQAGVSTELFMPQMLPYTKPDSLLKEFQKDGQTWMLHMVTKSPAILQYADLLAEMKSQVQVEVSFVTLDEPAAKIFEQGSPSVAQRLKIVEELSGRGVFVRMMMMPVLKEYWLRTVGKNREIVFLNMATGKRLPGRKRCPQADGNSGAGEVRLELFDGKRWKPATPGETWVPALKKDWSNVAKAQAAWRNYGASAYKQKELNYYYVDELIRANRENRPPAPERSRSEDPTAEALIHSGETVKDKDGNDRLVSVQALHMPRKDWPKGSRAAPVILRRMMDLGYHMHSKIDWVDCLSFPE
jgi:DNA repair photolyase